MDRKNFFGAIPEVSFLGMTFYEFSLSELGLPSADTLLKQIINIKNQSLLKNNEVPIPINTPNWKK